MFARFGVDQNATWQFSVVVDAPLLFHYFCVLGGSHVCPISILFSNRSLKNRFVVALRVSLGLVLGGFGGFRSGHFVGRFLHEFCMLAQERLNGTPKAAKSRPRAVPERPKVAQEHPKRSQERPKSGQQRPKSGQERLKRD